MLFCGCTISRTKQAATQAIVAKFSELSPDDKARLRQQREIIVTAAKQPYGTAALTKAVADLPLLQRLIDDKAFGKTPGHRTVSAMGHGHRRVWQRPNASFKGLFRSNQRADHDLQANRDGPCREFIGAASHKPRVARSHRRVGLPLGSVSPLANNDQLQSSANRTNQTIQDLKSAEMPPNEQDPKQTRAGFAASEPPAKPR
jgi:hypothetical protein